MKVLRLTSVTFPILDVATYGGYWDAYEVFENDFYELSNEKLEEAYWDSFDNDKFMKALADLANGAIASDPYGHLEYLEQFGVLKITGRDIYSPKFYNFSNDHLNIDVEVADNCFSKVVKALKKVDQVEFENWLKDNFTSYDGFMSFVPNAKAEFLQLIADGEERETGLGLWYLLKVNTDIENEGMGITELTNEMLDKRYEYLDFTEFCDSKLGDKIWTELNKVRG